MLKYQQTKIVSQSQRQVNAPQGQQMKKHTIFNIQNNHNQIKIKIKKTKIFPNKDRSYQSQTHKITNNQLLPNYPKPNSVVSYINVNHLRRKQSYQCQYNKFISDEINKQHFKQKMQQKMHITISNIQDSDHQQQKDQIETHQFFVFSEDRFVDNSLQLKQKKINSYVQVVLLETSQGYSKGKREELKKKYAMLRILNEKLQSVHIKEVKMSCMLLALGMLILLIQIIK